MDERNEAARGRREQQGNRGLRFPRGPLGPRFGLLWIIIGLIIFYNLYAFLRPDSSGQQPEVAYSSFVQAVERGFVSQATIAGQTVEGQFNQPLRVANGVVYFPDEPLPETVAASDVREVTRFRTVIPENTQPEVAQLLQEHGVLFSARASGGASLPSLLLSVLPFVFLLGLLVLLGRNLSRGQQNVFNFGRSRARVYDVERPQVTFADVAGEEEAKAELAQVVDFFEESRQVPPDRGAVAARCVADRPTGYRKDVAGPGSGRGGRGAVLQCQCFRVRRDVRRCGCEPGA